MIGFILLILAWLLLLPATLVNVILVASRAGIRGWVRALGGYFKNTARNLDVFAADEFRALWNVILVKNNGIRFIGGGKTISAYLGANMLKGTLTPFGKLVAFICDSVDNNHCLKAFAKEF